MILWTIQPVEVWELIQKEGVYICDKKKSEFFEYENFEHAYNWLVKQMERRIGARPAGVEYPVWAWHTCEGKHKKPDLRKSAYRNKRIQEVCMEIEIPDSDVILSDFSNWDYVLNNFYCDSSTSEEEWEEERAWFDSLSLDKQLKEKEESWNRIFDVERFENNWVSKGRFVQATFWTLRLENVKKVQFLATR